MYQKIYKSKIGDLLLESDGQYLLGLQFCNSKNCHKIDEKCFKELPIFDETSKWLDGYFAGKPPKTIPKYKLENATPFRQKVSQIMLEIPFGQVVTYNDIAKRIATEKGIKKMSAQAVGGAVGWNPICIIIPCHRVVGANGNLTGYGGGIENKINLLKCEKIDMTKFSLPKKSNKTKPNA